LHHHASVKAKRLREKYVAKGLSAAYILPSLGEYGLDPEALLKWESLSSTLPNWNKKLFIATSASDDDLPASTTAIECQEEFFRTKALTCKTPAKPRFVMKAQDTPFMELDVLPYSPFCRKAKQSQLLKKIILWAC
jgi:hypothetical protein